MKELVQQCGSLVCFWTTWSSIAQRKNIYQTVIQRQSLLVSVHRWFSCHPLGRKIISPDLLFKVKPPYLSGIFKISLIIISIHQTIFHHVMHPKVKHNSFVSNCNQPHKDRSTKEATKPRSCISYNQPFEDPLRTVAGGFTFAWLDLFSGLRVCIQTVID